MNMKHARLNKFYIALNLALVFGLSLNFPLLRPMNAESPPETMITASEDWAGEKFGTSVAIEGETAVVGIPNANIASETGAGTAYVYTQGAYGWEHNATLTAGEDSSNFGRSVAIHGDTIVVGAWQSVYVFVFDASEGWIRQAKLSPSGNSQNFGYSVDVDDVGSYQPIKTVIVGDPSDYSLGFTHGAAYVFQRNSIGNWTQKTKLFADDPAPLGYQTDEFGYSVALVGNRLLVGAPGDDHTETWDLWDAGSVYGFLYKTPPGEWVQETKLTSKYPVSFNRFGESMDAKYGLAIIGEGGPNESSSTEVFIFEGGWYRKTALYKPFICGDKICQYGPVRGEAIALDGYWISSDDPPLKWSGYVVVGNSEGAHVFQHGDDGEWYYQETLPEINPTYNDGFASSVAISGEQILVGAPNKDDEGEDTGVAYIYEQQATFLLEKKLAITDAELADHFGSAVAIDGNIAVIGVPDDDEAGTHTGAAYVFRRDTSGNWLQEAKLIAEDAAPGDKFGTSVAVDGTRIVVGAPYRDTWADDNGRAYIFMYIGAGNWLQEAFLNPLFAQQDSHFGWSVDISGDTIVVGMPLRKGDGGEASGKAEIFHRDPDPGGWHRETVLSGDAAYQYFGTSVAIEDDTIMVGIPGESSQFNNAGAAKIFLRDASDIWNFQTMLTASNAAAEDQFGLDIAISEDTVVVGAPSNYPVGGKSGSAYVFVRETGGNWSEQDKLTANDAQAEDLFGGSVAIDASSVVVGAPGKRTVIGCPSCIFSGAAYFFQRDFTGDWTQRTKLAPSDLSQGDLFGMSVGLWGDTVLIGAPWLDQQGAYSDEGAAYLYHWEGNTPEGSEILVRPIDTMTGGKPVSVYFQEVTQGGTTNLQSYDCASTPPPGGLKLGDPPVCYDLTTTAVFTPPAEVCIFYDSQDFDDVSSLVFSHYNQTSGLWETITPTIWDTEADFICGNVGSFSLFALFEVVNQPPMADAGGPYAVDEGGTVELTGSGSDPDSDPLMFAWDLDNNGTFETTGQNPSFSAAYRDGPDSQVILLQVCDDQAACDKDETTVEIANLPPTVDAGEDQTIEEGELVSFAGSFSDPGIADTHSIEWDFGDGVMTDSTLTPSHVYADNGTYTVTLTVTDDDGGVGSDTLTVTVNNVAPTVEAGADQMVNEGELVSFTGSFTNPGSADTYTIQWNFGDGVTTDGTLTPSHVYADNGAYIVTLTVTDDDGGVGSDTLTVTVDNVAPTVDAGSDHQIYEEDLFQFQGSFSDPGILDTHTATIDWGIGSIENATVTENNGSGVATGSHTYTEPGVYTVTLTVTDDDGGVGMDSMEMTVVYGFLNFCLFAEGDEHGVTIDQQVTVECNVGSVGEIKIKKQTLIQGNVISGGDVSLEKQTTVEGDVTAAGTVELKQSATVTGTIEQGASVPPITTVALSLTAGGPEVKIKKDGELDLDPGSYGNLKVGQGAILNLRSGEYAFTEIEMEKGATINLNLEAGWVVIRVVGEMTMQKETQIEIVGSGSAADVLFLVAGENIHLQKDVNFVGTVLAPNAHIHAHQDMILVGALYGRRVDLKQGVELIGLPALGVIVSMFLP